MTTDVPIDILLVEDNPGDVRLVREGLAGWVKPTKLRVVEDGEEALALLRGQGPHAGAARPDLVIVDLNLPRKDGRELVEELKSDPLLGELPVVVFTSSSSDRDVLRLVGLPNRRYIVKPVGLEGFLAAVRSIEGLLEGGGGA